MKSLEEIKTALTEKKAEELIADVISLVEVEKTRGIEEKRKANNEAQSLRKYKIAIEKHAREAGIETVEDADSFLNDLIEKAKTGEAGGKALKDKDALAKKFDELERKFKLKEQEAQTASAKAKQATIRAKLMNDLKDEIHAAGDVINSRLIGRSAVDLADDGETIVFVNGDERIDYRAGLDKFLAENSDIRKNKQIGGGGGAPPTGINKGQSTVTQTQLDGMTGKERGAMGKLIAEGKVIVSE
jgi:hypothetical protein